MPFGRMCKHECAGARMLHSNECLRRMFSKRMCQRTRADGDNSILTENSSMCFKRFTFLMVRKFRKSSILFLPIAIGIRNSYKVIGTALLNRRRHSPSAFVLAHSLLATFVRRTFVASQHQPPALLFHQTHCLTRCSHQVNPSVPFSNGDFHAV